MPISEKFNEYAWDIARQLEEQDIRVLVDDRNEKIGRKIRDNELKRIPYMLIVGEKEAENNEVSVPSQISLFALSAAFSADRGISDNRLFYKRGAQHWVKFLPGPIRRRKRSRK